MSRFRLIEAERASFSVPLMCRMLGGVSRSGYYDRRGRPLRGRGPIEPHRADPRDPRKKPQDLRLPASARRAS